MADAAALDTYRFEGAAGAEPVASFVHQGISVSFGDDLRALEREWRSFQAEADCTVFQSFEWLATWQRHVGARQGAKPLIVLGRDSERKLLFLLPLALQPSGFVRELVWLGMELCDYTGPLLAPDFSAHVSAETFAAIWQRILQQVAASAPFDVVHLDKMPETTGAQPNPMLQFGVSPNPSGAYFTALSGIWDKFYAEKRSAATRRRERTKRKSLAGFGEVRFVEPADAADRLLTVDLLMQQKARSLARIGVSNFFERPGYAEFYRAVGGDPIAHVSRLDIGPHKAAINLGLTMRGRYYHVLASYTDEPRIVRHGPGAAHLMDIMAHAIERGCTVFDFTVGDEPYKRDWCDERQTLYDHLSARTLKGAAAVFARSIAMRAKRTIKENPALWDAFFKVRTFAGSVKSRLLRSA